MKKWAVFLLPGLILWFGGCAAGPRAVSYGDMVGLPATIPQSADQASANAPAIDDSASLDDLLTVAALNSPALKAAFYSWKAGIERVPQVTALPDPRITYGYFIRNVETRVGPQRERIGVSQLFPWFGKLGLQGEMATAAAHAGRARFDMQKAQLFYTVKDVYNEYAYLVRAIGVMEENIQLLTYMEGVLRVRYSSGTASQGALLKLQVELDKLHDRLKNMTDFESVMQARLNAALNQSPGAALPRPDIPTAPDIPLEDDGWLERLKMRNPELMGGEHLVAASAAAVRLAGKSYYPDLMLSVEYINTDNAINPATLDSGKDPLVAMLSLNIPLWLGKNRAAVNEAKARHQVAVHEQQNRQNELLVRLETVRYSIREARRKIDLYTIAVIPRSRQSLNVARAAFEAGDAGLLDLIDAQRTLLAFELQLARERANINQRFAELEMLMGGTLGMEENLK